MANILSQDEIDVLLGVEDDEDLVSDDPSCSKNYKNSITVQEYKQIKKDTEETITELLKDFEAATGVEIKNVGIVASEVKVGNNDGIYNNRVGIEEVYLETDL